MTGPQPFRVDIAEPVLDDLRRRLERARLGHDYANDDWSYGFNGDFLAHLRQQWLHHYDWRAAESAINAWPQFRTEVEGVPIHFIHAKGNGPSPRPLILTHGWPWTFWDYHRVLAPLTDPAAHGADPTDAFDVVVPSLPGFGFSSPLCTPGINYWRTADLWVQVMDQLGYERFAAHGADWGATITAQLGHKYANRLIGIHVCGALTLGSWATPRPWAELLGTLASRAPEELRPAVIEWEKNRASHLTVQLIEPQTIAYALTDSPLALAAWILERRRNWSDPGDLSTVMDTDDLLTAATIYWITETGGTAARYYAEAHRNPWVPSHDRTPVVEAPSGVSLFGANNPPGYDSSWIGGYYNLVFQRDHPLGGHFPPIERPDQLVTDLRDMFRPLR